MAVEKLPSVTSNPETERSVSSDTHSRESRPSKKTQEEIALQADRDKLERGMAKINEMGRNLDNRAVAELRESMERTESWWQRTKAFFKRKDQGDAKELSKESRAVVAIRGEGEILKEMEKTNAAYAEFKAKCEAIMASGDPAGLRRLEQELSKKFDGLATKVALEGAEETKLWKKALKTGEQPPMTETGAELNDVTRRLMAVRGRLSDVPRPAVPAFESARPAPKKPQAQIVEEPENEEIFAPHEKTELLKKEAGSSEWRKQASQYEARVRELEAELGRTTDLLALQDLSAKLKEVKLYAKRFADTADAEERVRRAGDKADATELNRAYHQILAPKPEPMPADARPEWQRMTEEAEAQLKRLKKARTPEEIKAFLADNGFGTPQEFAGMSEQEIAKRSSAAEEQIAARGGIVVGSMGGMRKPKRLLGEALPDQPLKSAETPVSADDEEPRDTDVMEDGKRDVSSLAYQDTARIVAFTPEADEGEYQKFKEQLAPKDESRFEALRLMAEKRGYNLGGVAESFRKNGKKLRSAALDPATARAELGALQRFSEQALEEFSDEQVDELVQAAAAYAEKMGATAAALNRGLAAIQNLEDGPERDDETVESLEELKKLVPGAQAQAEKLFERLLIEADKNRPAASTEKTPEAEEPLTAQTEPETAVTEPAAVLKPAENPASSEASDEDKIIQRLRELGYRDPKIKMNPADLKRVLGEHGFGHALEGLDLNQYTKDILAKVRIPEKRASKKKKGRKNDMDRRQEVA